MKKTLQHAVTFFLLINDSSLIDDWAHCCTRGWEISKQAWSGRGARSSTTGGRYPLETVHSLVPKAQSQANIKMRNSQDICSMNKI